MQFIFSVLSLLIVTGAIVWWSTEDLSRVTEPTPKETTETLTPIEKATEVRNLIESKNQISLDLSGQGLTKAPDYIFSRKDLESLNLSNNELAGSLQAEIRHLQNLKTLNLSRNNFTGVPAEIGQLEKLEILDLSYNNLTGLPYELGNLANLKVLNLTGNNYSEADLEVIKKSLPASTIITTE